MLYVFLAILVLFFVFAMLSARGAAYAVKTAAFEMAATERAQAYSEYVKRTNPDSRLGEMSDIERVDSIKSEIRAYNASLRRVRAYTWLVVPAAILGFIVISQFAPGGPSLVGFVIFLISGLILVFFLRPGLQKALNVDYRNKGYDPERLHIVL